MGFTQFDWLLEQGRSVQLNPVQRVNLNQIRFGHRIQRKGPLEVPYLGVYREAFVKKRRERASSPEELGWVKYQLRLW